jgi:hypothetical protein
MYLVAFVRLLEEDEEEGDEDGCDGCDDCLVLVLLLLLLRLRTVLEDLLGACTDFDFDLV